MKNFAQRFSKEENLSEAELQNKIFSAYLNSSDEKINEVQKLLSIVSQLPKRDHFLDIGAHSGEVTIALSKMFKQTMAIESNSFFAKKLKKLAPALQVKNEIFKDLDFTGEKYDFILCSHTLNTIPEKLWMEVVNKMMGLLKENGKIAIVIQSPEGEMATFFEEFTGKLINVFPLWGKIVRKYGETAIKADSFSSQIKTRSLHDIISVGLYFLADKKFHSLRGEIASYFSSHHQTSLGYSVSQDELLITLTKQAKKT